MNNFDMSDPIAVVVHVAYLHNVYEIEQIRDAVFGETGLTLEDMGIDECTVMDAVASTF